MIRPTSLPLLLVALVLVFGSACIDSGDGDDDRYSADNDHRAIPDDDTYEPGERYLSDTGYVEYIPGDTPIVVSVPHGGYDEPDEIDDRSGTTVRDAYTLELGEEFAQAFYDRTGQRVHMINLLMARTKLDANRDLDHGAQGDPLAEQVWHEFHDFIDVAKDRAVDSRGEGFYVDLHGHGNILQRVELGYLLTGPDLRRDDDELDDEQYIEASSIRTLYENHPDDIWFPDLLRGDDSLGGLLEQRDHAAVPGPRIEAPEVYSIYFNGGYNTDVHGSSDGSPVSGVQIEAHRNVRFDGDTRIAFADDLAAAIIEFVQIHYGWDF